MRLIVTAGLVTASLLETIRLSAGIEWMVFERLTRDYEASKLAGYAIYVVGAAITILLFEPDFAVPAVLMLTIADPISGILASDTLKPIKRPPVLAITFVICLGVATPFVSFATAVAGATVAMVADGVKPNIAGYVIDDNVTILTGAAAAMQLATQPPFIS